MSVWDKIKESFGKDNTASLWSQKRDVVKNPSCYMFVDVEVGAEDKKIRDIGAVRHDGSVFHSPDKKKFFTFIKDIDFICGHNIIHHDVKYLFEPKFSKNFCFVDTLYLSPLLFPERPYHHLLKDDKLISDQINNPVNDCEKAKVLLMDEVARWNILSNNQQIIYFSLLYKFPEFAGFFDFVQFAYSDTDVHNLEVIIREEYKGLMCEHADLDEFIIKKPCELAYALSLIKTVDYHSITPAWVLKNFPDVEYIIRCLRNKRCSEGCDYCNSQLNIFKSLNCFFGYDAFRTYEGEPLQENAVNAAVDGKSLLAIFPTGGGKSLTFQLPALMAGRAVHGLTVVISPLQSLMKDQVDNLSARGLTDAVTINGLLDPISRAEEIKRVLDGDASLLYIAPEMLRSKTIERILMARHVVRFVIDEAHCFSSWGQDFRVDYLYIGKFISQYQKKKNCKSPIPVSCFTATAKQKVIQDIRDYFKQTLNLDFEIFASKATRTNLHYSVIHAETDEEKYLKLRSLISVFSCPTIVYVSRTKRTYQLAEKLTRDGYTALPFNGKMDSEDKIKNQECFMNDNVRIIVATSAFGMGVDKKDVGLVVHYDISDSLENYVQEAGRAGRDPNLQAQCFVLYTEGDLDKHFILLNQTKLSISEIQQVWKAIKDMTRQRNRVCCSALEIARTAGWDDSVSDIETRVRTALSALEQSGYLIRGNNVPHVYATGITVNNMDEARKRITESLIFDKSEVDNAIRIIKSLISEKYISKADNAEAESRVDYLADILGIAKKDVVSAVERMRQEGILADSKDISAFLYDDEKTETKAKRILQQYSALEKYLLEHIPDDSLKISYKQLNDDAQNSGINSSTEKRIRTLLYFLKIKEYVSGRNVVANVVNLDRLNDMEHTLKRFEKRLQICHYTLDWLYKLTPYTNNIEKKKLGVQFSVVELLNDIQKYGEDLFGVLKDVQLEDVEEALLYLSKIGALKIEGGFLVLYNAMDITRIKDNKLRYKIEDYRNLNDFYKQKMQQIHIVGEYANLMVKSYDAALQYVQDYFHMDYKRFISKYFKGERCEEIERNITPLRYNNLFGTLSAKQREIIDNKDSKCIVVAAGPGSGKTRVLVHKLASLLMLEDVKHEQLLMLTFSRAAAVEFKNRLMDLIGNAAHYVEIKTFHSYCFDLLGKIGNLEDAKDVVLRAAEMINAGEVEQNRIAKTVLVIDEAQDMSENEYRLVRALMSANEEMRVIAVGDDDQNIFEFRGSNSMYMRRLLNESSGTLMEMTENFRSTKNVVSCANSFVKNIANRMKSNLIVSKKNDEGFVRVTYHKSDFMYEPLVNELRKSRNNNSVAVLTQTNEEAAIIVALLRKYRLQCKLIQSTDGFRFINMMEMRYFIKNININNASPLISDDVWEKAKSKTCERYSTSESLQYFKRCVEVFEHTNKVKYRTDFVEFVYESSVEDFCTYSGNDIVVSTIHKSKGREFDDVYMLISKKNAATDVDLRKYYVGITRAKQRLFIHTNCSLFDNIVADERVVDRNNYDMPDEVVLQLSLKDVNLNFVKSRKSEILKLRAGDNLRYDNYYFFNDNNIKVSFLSQKMQKELEAWYNKGYALYSSKISFILAWRPKDAPKDEPEYAVVLIDLSLTKRNSLPPTH